MRKALDPIGYENLQTLIEKDGAIAKTYDLFTSILSDRTRTKFLAKNGFIGIHTRISDKR
jgi:hypothetical protein